MRLLLDECLPRKLKQELAEYEVWTVQDCGWKGKKNGELLRLAEKQFDVFITIDKGMQYQQNVSKFRLGIIMLSAPTNRVEALKLLIPSVKKSLEEIKAGNVVKLAL